MKKVDVEAVGCDDDLLSFGENLRFLRTRKLELSSNVERDELAGRRRSVVPVGA